MNQRLKPLFRSLSLLLLVVIIGVTGYILIEGYSLVEAFFMLMITISTVGFREVEPLSEEGMIFTIFLIIFSFGIFAYVITSFTRFIVEGYFYDFVRNYTLRNKLRKMKNHIIVCGYGRNGQQAVSDLLDHAEKVIVIENNTDIEFSSVKGSSNIIFLQADATLDETMHRANITEAKALLTTLPDDASNLLVAVTARGLNPKLKIVSRASTENVDSKLRKAGADNVIMPDRVGGARMARLVSQEDVVEFVETLLLRDTEDVNLEEIYCKDLKSDYINKTIKDLDVRTHSGANLIGMKTADGNIIFNPPADTKIIRDAKLFALGKPNQIAKLKKILTSKE